MGRAELLLIVLVVAPAACRDAGDAPSIPDPRVDRALDAGRGPADAGTLDALAVPPLGMRQPGRDLPVGLDPTRVTCTDPVVGVWVAKTFAESAGRWHEHRLSIRRDADDELVADQTTRIWDGGADDALPSLCPQGGPSWGVYKIGDRARFVDGILHVWGVSLVSSTHTCDGEVLSYNLDSFTGRVSRDQYKARNNDGSQAVNRPYYFRRIACAPD